MAENEHGELRIHFAGDVMIGRLIDQLLPTHVSNPEEAAIVRQFRINRGTRLPHLQEGQYKYETVWGNTLPLWKQGHLNVINLETSVTTHDQLWPRKVFNYRTHPDNIACLLRANIDHVSLANNHTLDFGVPGLEETCNTLKRSGISYVGAGKTREDALGPAFLDIPTEGSQTSASVRVALLSASDHPTDWSSVDSFHLLARYDHPSLYEQLKPLIAKARANADLVIFSVHWGPNYQWIPDQSIQKLARWMIDEGVDVIHGHSSHHLQGLEIIERKDHTSGLILYGCGDFVDDYAVEEAFRNDLSALFRLHVSVSSDEQTKKVIRLDSLSIYPTRCSNFQVNRLNSDDPDWRWIQQKLVQRSHIAGKTWIEGQDNELILSIS